MQPSRARLICRSQNSFTPSIALWQHFVLPGRPFVYHRRLSYSTSSKAEPDASPTLDSSNIQPPLITGTVHPQSSPTIRTVLHGSPGPLVRKLTAPRPSPRKVTRLPINRVLSPAKTQVKPTTGTDPPLQEYKPRKGPPPRLAPNTSLETNLNSPQSLLIRTKSAIDQDGDYKGVIMKPRQVPPTRYVATKHLPWAIQPMEKTVTGQHEMKTMERLNIEIMRFHEFVIPSRYEALSRMDLIEKVRSHVRHTLPDSSLEVFGSERTGLALATSDIDFRLSKSDVEGVEGAEALDLPPPVDERRRLLKDIHKLHRDLSRKTQYEDCAILYARYPLISLRDRDSGLDIQIVLSNDTSLSRSMVQKYIQEYPYIRMVFSVVKSLFEIRGMSDTFRGGFGSYAIFMMIVASLRHCILEKPPATAAEGLLAFITFWSTFDTTTKGVSIEPAEFYDKDTEAPRPGKVQEMLKNKDIKAPPVFYLSLRDPADPTNDLGRKGLAIKHVQATLSDLLIKLKRRLIQNSDGSILAPLVGPIFALTNDQRNQLRAHGEKVSKKIDNRLVKQAKKILDSATPTNIPFSSDLTKSVTTDGDEAVKLDFEPFQDTGDALKHILRMPSAEALAGEPESNTQEIQYSEVLSVTGSLPTEQEDPAKNRLAPQVPSTETKIESKDADAPSSEIIPGSADAKPEDAMENKLEDMVESKKESAE